MQVFLDMAVLVDAQGEMLDNIESQVIELIPNAQQLCQVKKGILSWTIAKMLWIIARMLKIMMISCYLGV